MKRGDLYRVVNPSPHDPKRSRVFVVVSRQVLIDSRFSTVICAPIYTSYDIIGVMPPSRPLAVLAVTAILTCLGGPLDRERHERARKTRKAHARRLLFAPFAAFRDLSWSDHRPQPRIPPVRPKSKQPADGQRAAFLLYSIVLLAHVTLAVVGLTNGGFRMVSGTLPQCGSERVSAYAPGSSPASSSGSPLVFISARRVIRHPYCAFSSIVGPLTATARSRSSACRSFMLS